jgi:aspartate aminotransferase
MDALQKFSQDVLEYSPSQGIKSLRTKMVGYYAEYGIDLSPDEIIITTGGSEAIMFAYMACLNPGDEIIVTDPSYANYMAFAISCGAIVKSVKTDIEDGFRLPSIEEFEKQITEKTRAILICNPNNPTGYLYSKKEMMQIRDLVKKYNLYLFSDEVYREFIYTKRPYISAFHLEDIEQNVVLIDSVSKRYSECGIRIGALITKNREVHNAVMKFCQARLSPPLIGQVIAEASLSTPQEYMEEVYDEYLARRNFLIDQLNQIPGVFAPTPMGAFYVMASLPVDDADKFQRWLLEVFDDNGDTVMFAPGAPFYETPGKGINEVRIAYVRKQEDLERSMELLAKGIARYQKEQMDL